MKTHLIEATNGPNNWGKFMVGQFVEEWHRASAVRHHDFPMRPLALLRDVGWGREHRMVFDLQTGEGAMFLPGGHAKADLEKHAIWVCPLFEPFLEWLYDQPLPINIDALPDHVDLPDAPFAMSGFRRPGPSVPG